MATRSDAPDPAVDELRRKARRRLVGAVVLALAAAVALPLLLENEPKPLGDDVSIQIPPVDSGKFVTPLSPAAPPEGRAKDENAPPANAETVAIPPSPPNADAARIEPAKTEPPKSEPAKSESPKNEPAKSEPAKNESKGEPPSPAAGQSAPRMPARTSETDAAIPPASATGTAETKPEAKSSTGKAPGTFVVQVAAFSDRYGARTMVAKLKKGGFPSYTETVATDKGTLHRVRVGPYPSREVADAARAKLKAAGYNGVVARSG